MTIFHRFHDAFKEWKNHNILSIQFLEFNSSIWLLFMKWIDEVETIDWIQNEMVDKMDATHTQKDVYSWGPINLH